MICERVKMSLVKSQSHSPLILFFGATLLRDLKYDWMNIFLLLFSFLFFTEAKQRGGLFVNIKSHEYYALLLIEIYCAI
jgi:hypothetical protein